MKALFFAMCPSGAGETLIGLSLADQIRPLGVTSHFIIEPHARDLLDHGRRTRYAHTVLEPEMGPYARLMVDDIVRRFSPDLIVLADYFTHVGPMRRRYGMDPWFIDSYQLPVVPIDIWEWEKTDFNIDVVHDKSFHVDERFGDLPAHLRPVPLAHLARDGTGRARPFRVWAGGEAPPDRARHQLRAELGLGRHDRLVMLATAAWQNGVGHRVGEMYGPVHSGMSRLLACYLGQLPAQTHFLFVGQAPQALDALPADRVHAISACGPRRFSALLGAADLVVSVNIAATTVTRAVMSGIPALVFGNRFRIGDSDDAAKAEAELGGLTRTVREVLAQCMPLYPFRMWPLGYRTFLEPLLTDNPFTEAVAQAEILDEPTVVADMTSILYDTDFLASALARETAYGDAVRGMPDTCEVFSETVEQLGLVVR